MRTTSANILKTAAETAAEMLDASEEIRAVPFGTTQDCLFVSTNSDMLDWTDTFFVADKKIFFGPKKRPQTQT